MSLSKSVRNWVMAGAAATALSAGSIAHAAETIKVGVLHSLSGTMAISETTLKDAMLMLIEEQNNLGTSGSDAKFAAAANQNHGEDSRTASEYFEKNKTNPGLFSVGHFAGAVEYDITGFVEKNSDSTSESLLGMARTSEIKLVQKVRR